MSANNTAFAPTAPLSALILRARVLERTRAFFNERGVLEVDTPILGLAPVTDPSLSALKTRISHFKNQDFYLQTSPEYYLKRLIAAFPISMYQLGKVFRDDEYGSHHSPEFTMLEWYRMGFDDNTMMKEIADLLNFLWTSVIPARTDTDPTFGRDLLMRVPQHSEDVFEQAVSLGRTLDWYEMKVERLSYREAFEEYLGINPHQEALSVLQALVKNHVGDIVGLPSPDCDTCLQLLMSTFIEPALAKRNAPVFIYNFPKSQAALARLKIDETGEEVAGRFELYWKGLELANGYYELMDPALQSQRFKEDLARRAAANLSPVPVDQKLLAALEAGFPSCSGVALGFDRLLMLLADASHIKDVQAFYTF